MIPKIPESLKLEHEELHADLVRATKAGGKTGEAAKAVAKVLHEHFVKEEEFALPPIGLLAALARGEVDEEMAQCFGDDGSAQSRAAGNASRA